MRQVSSYLRRWMVISGPSTDEAGLIYILEKVDGSLSSLTHEVGIIYLTGEGVWFPQVPH